MKNKLFNWNDEELKFFEKIKSPNDIQLFLNDIPYNPEYITKSPRFVLKYKTANCFEGSLFAAACLRMLNHKPLIIDLLAQNDDDHVIAVYKKNNLFGSVAKSNTTTLRARDPVFRTVRELVMSYFPFYFNTLGEKSLISYSNPVYLSKFDKYNWMTTGIDLSFIGDYLYKVKHHSLVKKRLKKSLSNADVDLMKVCFAGSIEEGLFKPKQKK